MEVGLQQQGQSGGHEHAQQLRTVAGVKGAEAVREMVEGFGGQTVLPVRTRSLIWPGVNRVKPEPIARLEAVRELERAAHAVQLGYICQARQAGRSWYEMGGALDLHWAASANKESIVVEVYDYALELGRRPGLGRPPLTWTCSACQETIIDHGPYGDPAPRPGSSPWMRRHQRGFCGVSCSTSARTSAGTGGRPEVFG